ncbi:ABC transporter ATP-binding protein [Acholeplasma hippikon]|uniref:ABC-type multidrug/protein/lipid transport system ATPase component n=1 Tax=Acholeplasma hippikon TaxID=264636 RepID=A0A449BIG5_9MOLU|nr:ABC transporter ATP-binding protein [Acholeplasma hippikon]VEU82254.1 ABC-type multidrug/protein/lipid transport system ATPase component [Acholeplasma hippikon]
MLKILKHIKTTEWLWILVSILLIGGQVWLELEIPTYMGTISKMALEGNANIWDIVVEGLKMLGLAFGSLISAVIVGLIFARISSRFSARLRSMMFTKTADFSMEEINAFSTPSLITRSTNDITQVQNMISMGAQLLLKAPILAIWSIYKISGSQWQFTAITAGAILAISIVLVVIIFVAVPRFKRIQKNTDELNKYSRENLAGLRVIKAYNAEKFQTKKIDTVNDVLMTDGLLAGRIMSLISPTMALVLSGVSLSIYWIGAHLIDGIPFVNMLDRVDIYQQMIIFSQYAMQVIMAFMMLVMIFIILPRAQVSAGRILEVLNKKTKIKDGSQPLKEHVKTLEFNNVSFQYPDASDPVLENISFKANKGQTVAIIGATGAGKSTMINLIPRFYDVTEGEILINGQNIKQFKAHDLRKKIGYISQQAFLFSGTIGSNVNYGLEEEKELDYALEIAQASDFVNSLEEKGNSRVSQAGKNFSGGQKQRLSIARAIQRDAEVLIFDDSFSALDYRTDRNLRNALKENLNNQITLIVAQRIGTIKNADVILVLDEGKIVGAGTHKELLKDNKVYREIALSQLSEEELANE